MAGLLYAFSLDWDFGKDCQMGNLLAGAVLYITALGLESTTFWQSMQPDRATPQVAELSNKKNCIMLAWHQQSGSVPGAMLGGILLGIFESVGPNLVLDGLGIPAANQLKDVIAFTMLVLVLIFRPQGIMGEKLSEKKA